jgi:predicted transcriptional regulator
MSKRSFTVNLDEEIITKINKLAKVNELKTSELVSRVLLNFVNNFDILNDKKQVKETKDSDDEKYVELRISA